MSRKKNMNWKRTVKKQATRDEMWAESQRGLLGKLSPQARHTPPFPPAIAADIADVVSGASLPARPAHPPNCTCAKCRLKRTS